MISGASCSQSKPHSSKRSWKQRKPGTIVETGAENIKIIIAFCSLSRGATANKAGYQKGFIRVGRKGVADLSCSALCPSQEVVLDTSLTRRQEAPRVHGSSLRQDKISELFCAFPPVTG